MSIQPSDYLSLSVDERWQLIGEIETSIYAETDGGLSPEQREELLRRAAHLESHPEDGLTWEELKAGLRTKS